MKDKTKLFHRRGGRRPNQTGRPVLPDDIKRVSVSYTLPPYIIDAVKQRNKLTRVPRSAIVEEALIQYLGLDKEEEE